MRHTVPLCRLISLLCLLATSCLGGHAHDADFSAQNPSSPNQPTAAGDPNQAAALWPTSVCPAGPFDALPFDGQTKVETLVASIDGADWSEGPVWVAATQQLIFGAAATADDDSASKKTALYACDPTTANITPVAAAGVVRSNGLFTDPNGLMLAACHQPQGLVTFPLSDPSNQTLLADQYEGASFDAPNDGVWHASGTLFFTDTTYEQAGRGGQPVTGIYGLKPSGEVFLIDGTRSQPNGIALSLEQDLLFVGGLDKKLMRYSVDPNGAVGAAETMATFKSNVDGMGVDCAGHLIVTLNDTKQLAVVSTTGAVLATLQLQFTPSNVAFGGADRKTLFITGQGGLYRLSSQIPGLPF